MRSIAITRWQRVNIGLGNTIFGLTGTLFNFLLSVIIVRHYSTELWGTIAQLMLLMTFVSQVTGWGNKDFLMREFARSNEKAFIWQSLLVSRILVFLPLLPVLILFDFGLAQWWLFSLWCLANYILKSFDSIIVFERRFREAVFIEIAGFGVIALAMILLAEAISADVFIMILVISSLFRIGLYIAVFKGHYFNSYTGTISGQYLALSLPYFLPPFIAFLNLKADSLVIARVLPNKEFGEYYLLTSLLSYCPAIAALAIYPFLKNVYRINLDALSKLKRTFFLLGMPWTLICLAGTYLALEFIYNIHLGAEVYFISALSLPPFFVYYFKMQEFFRMDNPYPVVYINLLAAVLNFAMSVILVRSFGFVGGIISFACTQWIVLIAFAIYSSDTKGVVKQQVE